MRSGIGPPERAARGRISFRESAGNWGVIVADVNQTWERARTVRDRNLVRWPVSCSFTLQRESRARTLADRLGGRWRSGMIPMRGASLPPVPGGDGLGCGLSGLGLGVSVDPRSWRRTFRHRLCGRASALGTGGDCGVAAGERRGAWDGPAQGRGACEAASGVAVVPLNRQTHGGRGERLRLRIRQRGPPSRGA